MFTGDEGIDSGLAGLSVPDAPKAKFTGSWLFELIAFSVASAPTLVVAPEPWPMMAAAVL
jgi:hypothetical protein